MTAVAEKSKKTVITTETVFYQAEYGGGEWEDSWKSHSGLYTKKEYALEFLDALGFDVTTCSYSDNYSLKTNTESEEGYSSNYEPHWSRVIEVYVIK